ncbi:porin family protein [Adhaeribacter terreus]|uniref:Porin family protein n=1 Tax=Adhaeribacter terreus TaxID=529703 RepID=A0ABW0ED41_9BACT
MKKALLLIVAVFAFSFANAQGFKFGVKGGVNYSTVSGGDKEDFFGDPDYKTSYHFGISTLYEIDDFWGIKPELLYTSKGYQLNNKFDNELGGTTDLEVKTNLNYISLPILLNINAGGLYFELGPELAYLAAATGEVKVDKRDANDNKINDDKNEYQIDEDAYAGFDFGYVAGIGYQSDMGLGIGLRYNGGAKSIFDTKDSEEPNVKNSNFMLSLSWMFGGN